MFSISRTCVQDLKYSDLIVILSLENCKLLICINLSKQIEMYVLLSREE